MDAAAPGDAADIELTGHCIDYVGGFSDGAVGTHQFCTGDASTGTIIRVYVLFMRDHPKLLDEHREIGFLMAMQENFPCKIPPKTTKK